MAFEISPFRSTYGRPHDARESKPSSRASWKIFAVIAAAVAVLVVLTDTRPFEDAATPANRPAANQQPDPTR